MTPSGERSRAELTPHARGPATLSIQQQQQQRQRWRQPRGMERSTREIPPLYCTHPLPAPPSTTVALPTLSLSTAHFARYPRLRTCFVLTRTSRRRFTQKRMSRGETKGELPDNYRPGSHPRVLSRRNGELPLGAIIAGRNRKVLMNECMRRPGLWYYSKHYCICRVIVDNDIRRIRGRWILRLRWTCFIIFKIQ